MPTTSYTIPPKARTLWHNLTTNTLSLISHPVPSPTPHTTEHLIRVQTLAPCAGELTWPFRWPAQNPAKEPIPIDDVAGTVVAAPVNSPFPVGSEVFARTNYNRTGCAAEYAIAVTEELALKPRNLSWEEAVTVPLSAMTAWQALFVHGGLGINGGSRGKRVLVTAASGGVGVWLVQLAKVAGCEVIGTCGPDNISLVRDLGANEVLNYRQTRISDWVSADATTRKVDLVIDLAGGSALHDAWFAVKDGGKVISISPPPDQVRPDGFKGKDVEHLFFIMQPDGKQLGNISKLVEEGKCKPVLDSVYNFDEFEKAFARVDGGHAKGKVVIRVRE
jgi:NADPH:quinone reductase-like Zn-dependent oxidoreductase